MRRLLAGMLALAAVAPMGCFNTHPDRSVSRYETQVPFSSLNGEDVVQLDVYLVERPAADACLSKEVWEWGDEQVYPERKSILQENGFRACVLGETPPDSLQALMHSERSCANPRRLRMHVGKAEPIFLNPAESDLHFQVHQDGRKTDVDLKQAQCVLLVATQLNDEGKLVVHFTPTVRHGETATSPKPVADATGVLRWDVATEQPTETYSGLSWDLTVAPDTYIAVGALPDRPETLGPAAFLSSGTPRMQRLLVLRPGRALPNAVPKEEPDGKAAPLASQAGRASARGVAP
ncbi:MAG TPA: hypothetical protein VMS17_11080 [Gemmataceae bacterium]|nr:hypothetical protein [Gemmataceae bacterium]